MVKGKKKNIQLKMSCDENDISGIIKKIIKEIEKMNYDIKDLKFRVKMAGREMIANAIEHGCQNEKKDINIIFKITSSELILKVKDPGDGFDWRKKDLFQMPLLAEKGRGMGMINQAADRIEFNEKGNIITAFFKV